MGIKLISVFSIAFLVFAQNITAQETGPETGQNIEETDIVRFYNSELFHWNYNMFDGLTLVYKNQSSSTSFRINEMMRNAFLEYSDSSQEYNSYRKKTITGNVLIYSGLALALSAFIPLYSNIENEAAFYRNINISIGLSVSGLVSTIIGSFFSSSGQENIFNAVNMFNKNKLQELTR
jgi:hypothetical protein